MMISNEICVADSQAGAGNDRLCHSSGVHGFKSRDRLHLTDFAVFCHGSKMTAN